MSRTTKAFGIAAALALLFNAILTVLKENIDSIHDFLVKMSGHHWISHGILTILFFIIAGFFLSKFEVKTVIQKTLIISLLMSMALIMVFFGQSLF